MANIDYLTMLNMFGVVSFPRMTPGDSLGLVILMLRSMIFLNCTQP